MTNTDRASIEKAVLESLVNVLKVDACRLHRDMSLAESGIDSLGLVEAVFVLEQRFDVAIPFNANEESDDGAGAFRSVGQLLDQVVDLVVAKQSMAVAMERG